MGGFLASFTVAPASTSPFCVVTVPFKEVPGPFAALGVFWANAARGARRKKLWPPIARATAKARPKHKGLCGQATQCDRNLGTDSLLDSYNLTD